MEEAYDIPLELFDIPVKVWPFPIEMLELIISYLNNIDFNKFSTVFDLKSLNINWNRMFEYHFGCQLENNRDVYERYLNAEDIRKHGYLKLFCYTGWNLHHIVNLKEFKCNFSRWNLTYPRCLKAFVNLTKLDLVGNKIRVITKEIYYLFNLTHLNLSTNLIKDIHIPENIRNLINLEYLNLDGNRLKCIPRVIIELKNLKTLILSRNKI